jgi:hypothetical protein
MPPPDDELPQAARSASGTATAHECAGTGGSGDGGVPPYSTGGAGGGGSGAGGSTGSATGGTTGSADAGGAGGASQAAWTCNEGAGNCACETYPVFSATSCSAGPYSCCKSAASALGIDLCTCTNTITAANWRGGGRRHYGSALPSLNRATMLLILRVPASEAGSKAV